MLPPVQCRGAGKQARERVSTSRLRRMAQCPLARRNQSGSVEGSLTHLPERMRVALDELAHEIVRACLFHDLPKAMRMDEPAGLSEPEQRKTFADWLLSMGYSSAIAAAVREVDTLRPGRPSGILPSATAPDPSCWERNLTVLVAYADSVASGMPMVVPEEDRDPRDVGEPASGLQSLMPNILAHVDIGKGTPPRRSVFPPQGSSFPTEAPVNETFAAAVNVRQELAEALTREIHDTNLLEVLRTHLMNLPEVNRTPGVRPAASLFQHLKSTAAIGLCTYLYLRDARGLDPVRSEWREQLTTDQIERYLLVAGEIVGIADFLGAVSSKWAMRMMRARSFYLHLLVDTAVSMLVDEGGLARCCVVFRGGGVFYLLGPNTERFRDALSRVYTTLNDWLGATFGLTLYFPIVSHPLTAAHLAADVGSIWSDVNAAIEEDENHRWQWTLPHIFETRNPGTGQCDACQQESDKTSLLTGLSLCPFCVQMARLGRILPRLDLLGEVPEEGTAVVSIANRRYGARGPFTRQYSLRGIQSVGDPTVETCSLPTGAFVSEADLDLVASASTGVRRLGVLSMDVDDLTRIFRKGLIPCSVSTLSELSDRIDWFVKEYVPASLPELAALGPLGLSRDHIDMSVVYSGGDEILLVGAWDQVVDLAFGVERRFRDYTSNNPNLTLSAGIAIVDYRLAMHKATQMAYSEQGRAKRAGKNKLSLFSRPVSWQEGDTVRELMSLLTHEEGRKVKLTCSRGLLGALLQEWGDQSGWHLPRVYYLLRRAKRPDLVKGLVHRLDSDAVGISLQLADLLTRGDEPSGY